MPKNDSKKFDQQKMLLVGGSREGGLNWHYLTSGCRGAACKGVSPNKNRPQSYNLGSANFVFCPFLRVVIKGKKIN